MQQYSQTSLSPSQAPAHPIRRRLWKIGIAFFCVLAIAIGFVVRENLHNPKLSRGHDLLPSYAAAVLVRNGQYRLMYDRAAMSAVETQIIADANLDMDPRYGPWLNPPFFVWFFVPLAALPYRQAALIFLVLNIVLLAISLKGLTCMLLARSPGESFETVAPKNDWRT